MPEATPELLLTVALTLALILTSGALAALLSSLHRSAGRRLDATSAAIHGELAALREEGHARAAAVAGLAERLERLAAMLDTDQQHRTGPAPRSEAGYELAIRLARSGAGTEELVTACGMSRKEAEVVARLHGRPAAAVATARNRLAVVPR